MAEAEDVKDQPEEKKEEVLDSLDAVHERVVADLENEDSEESDDDSAEDDDAGSKDAGADKDDSAEDAEDDSDAGAADEPDAPEDKPADDPVLPPDEEKPAPEDKPAPELDTDSTKNAPGKIAVKDFEDKTHYFNNLDEVPEEFEPKSYKEWGRFVQKATDKEQSERKAAEEASVKAAADEKAARIKSIKDDWDKDIKTLTDNKTLPEDAKERQSAINGVFDVMNEKLARGKVIDFETGYEIYSSKKGADDKKEAADKTNKDKKKRGGMVVGAGSSPSVKTKIVEGPPPGITLDDVHEQVLNSL